MLETKQLMVAIDFHAFFSHTIEVNGYHQTFCLPNILQNTFFCGQQKKETLTGLEQLGP